MPISDWQEVVQAAWDSIKAKVAADLPVAVMGKNLSDQSYADRLGVCAMLNSPTGSGSAIWGDKGSGTIRLTSIRISDLTAVTAQPAKIVSLDVRLTLTFSVLQASGRYNYVQPCALYSLGKEASHTEVTGAGTMNAKSENGSLTYLLKVIDPDQDLRLQLTGAIVDGQRTINVKPDGEPDNAVLRWLVDVFGRGGQVKAGIAAALDSFFSHDRFSQDMVNELNRIIGQTLAARR